MYKLFFLIISILCFSKISAIDNFEIITLENKEAVTVQFSNEKAMLYINKYLHIAISEMDRSGVPASIKMAQAILESASGMSDLAKHAHNHFGIKCGGSWKGKTYYHWDDDVVKSCFRVFERDEDSFIAHTDFLTNPSKNSRYGFLFKFKKHDYKAWANGLQKAGYATSKTYAQSLISIIERFKLYKLDHLTFKSYLVQEGEIDSLFQLIKYNHEFELPFDLVIFQEPNYILIPDTLCLVEEEQIEKPRSAIIYIKDKKAVKVQEHLNLSYYSQKYKVKERQLKLFNDLDKEDKLIEGQLIFLEFKNNKYTGVESYHISLTGETLYDIAQQYAVKLKTLEKLNILHKKRFIISGTKILLK